MVQWLALFASNAEGLSSILGLGNSACHLMHTKINKLKKQKHSQQLQQPLVILLKTHSQDSDQRNDCNIHSGAPTQILPSGPQTPSWGFTVVWFHPTRHFLRKWSQASGCPQPLLSSNWFQTSGLHSHYPSSSSNAFQPQSGSRLFPIPAPSS